MKTHKVNSLVSYLNNLQEETLILSKRSIVSFIQDIYSRSEKKRLDGLKSFLLANSNSFSQEEISFLLEPLAEIAVRASNTGKKYSQRKRMQRPWFKEDFAQSDEKMRGKFVLCDGCHQNIELPSPVFYLKLGYEWTFWHPFPNCFPAELKDEMNNNHFYCKWKMISNNTDTNEIE